MNQSDKPEQLPGYGRNPLTGLWQAFRALGFNIQAAVIILSITALIAILPPLLEYIPGTAQSTEWQRNLALLNIASAIVSFIATAVMLVLALACSQQTNMATSAIVKRGLRRCLPLFGLMLLSGIMILGGTILFIIPGIIIAIRLALAPYILIDKNVGPWTAIKMSNRLMKKNAVELFGIYTLTSTIMVLSTLLMLIFPGIGTVIGGLVIIFAGQLCNIYLAWLYQDLSSYQETNLPRPKTHPSNVWLPIAGVSLSILGLLGLLIWIIRGLNPTLVSHKTACYELQLPSAYKVEQPKACHIIARSDYAVLEYRPVTDSAISAEQLSQHQKNTIFPSDRYSLAEQSGTINQSIDDQPAMVYSLIDAKDGTNLTAAFVHSRPPHILDQKQIHNFILIQRSNSEVTTTRIDPAQLASMSVHIAETLTWNSVGSAAYVSAIEAANAAWANEQFAEVVLFGNTALSLAKTDYETALAYSWRGMGKQIQKDDAGAEPDLQAALKLDPHNLQALDTLSVMNYGQRKYDQALGYIERALVLDNRDATAYNIRGLIREEQGNKTAAIADLEMAAKLNPDDTIIQENLNSARNSK